MDDIKLAKDLQAKISSATPYVIGPVTYYVVGTDALNTGDGELITVHTVIEDTGSDYKNADLCCFGPLACNYHLKWWTRYISSCNVSTDLRTFRSNSIQTSTCRMEFL